MLGSGDGNSDDPLVYPMPIPRNNVLDHDYTQPNFSTASFKVQF